MAHERHNKKLFKKSGNWKLIFKFKVAGLYIQIMILLHHNSNAL